jgi:uncharacterized protein (TIGR03000 family)
MSRHCISGFVVVVLTGASLLLLPQTSDAQRRGGGGRAGAAGGYAGGYRSYGYTPYRRAFGGYGGYGYGYSGYGYANSGFSNPGITYPTQPYANDGSTGAYESFYPPQTSQPDNTVHVRVRVPAQDAEVWFQDARTDQRGTVREFESPELTPGFNYSYHIRARWMDNGKVRDQTRAVTVRAGQSVSVDFNTPDTAAATTDNPRQ